MKKLVVLLGIVGILTAGCFDFNNENHNYPPGQGEGQKEGLTLEEWVQRWHDTPSIQDKYSLDTWIGLY